MTVKELQKVLDKLVKSGREDYEILVAVEMVFTSANIVDVDDGGKAVMIGD